MLTTLSHTSPPPTPRSFAGTSVSSRERENLIGALFEELLNSTLLTAASASIAIWTMARPDTVRRRNLTCYLPPSPQLFPQALLTFCMSFDLTASLREYYDRLDFLRGLTFDYADDGEGNAPYDVASVEVLTGSWQDLALTGRKVAMEMATQISITDFKRHRERFDRVVELLAEIERGGHPCIDSAGTITVPFWAERRQLRRKPLNLQAYLAIGQRIERVAVINASSKGIGVAGLTGIKVGTVVQLLLSPGHSIAGSVVWSNADQGWDRTRALATRDVQPARTYRLIPGEAVAPLDDRPMNRAARLPPACRAGCQQLRSSSRRRKCWHPLFTFDSRHVIAERTVPRRKS